MVTGLIFMCCLLQAQNKWVDVVKIHKFSSSIQKKVVTRFIFNTQNKLVSISSSSEGNLLNKQTYYYKNSILIKKVEIDDGNVSSTTYEYDSLSRIKKMAYKFMKVNESITEYDYQISGVYERVSTLKNGKLVDKTIAFTEYNSNGLINRNYVINAVGDTVINNSYSYDKRNNIIVEKSLDNVRRYVFFYNDVDSLVKMKQYINETANKVYIYSYHDHEKGINITDSLGNIIEQKKSFYSKKGVLIKETIKKIGSFYITYYNSAKLPVKKEVYFDNKLYSSTTYNYANPFNLPLSPISENIDMND